MAQGDLTTGSWVQDPNQSAGERNREPKYIWKDNSELYGATDKAKPWHLLRSDIPNPLRGQDQTPLYDEQQLTEVLKRTNAHLDKYSPDSPDYDQAYAEHYDWQQAQPGRGGFWDGVTDSISGAWEGFQDSTKNVWDAAESLPGDLTDTPEERSLVLTALGAGLASGGATGPGLAISDGPGPINAINAGAAANTLAPDVVNPTGSGFTGDVTGGTGLDAVPTGIEIGGNLINPAANADGFLNPDGTWNDGGTPPVTPPPVTPPVTPLPVTPPPGTPPPPPPPTPTDWTDPALIGLSGLISGYLANDAADNATDLNREIFNTINENNEPYMDLGQTGINNILNPDTGIGSFDTTVRPEWEQYSNFVAPEDFKFEAKTDPGYNFIFDEAMRATDRGSAANKAYNSGNAMTALQDRAYSLADTNLDDQYRRQLGTWNANLGKDLTTYGLNYGANMDDFNMRFGLYGDDYNKYQDNINNNMNLVNTGLTATGGANQSTTNYGTNAANIGQGAAWNTSEIINDSIKNWLTYNSGK